MRKRNINGRLREYNGYFRIVIYWLDENGKQKSKSFSTELKVKGNKKEAEILLNQKLVEFRKKQEEFLKNNTLNENNQKIKFTDFLKNSLEGSKNQVEENTFESYKSVIDKVMIPYFEKEDLFLQEVEVKDILKYYDYLSNERKVSNNTIVHHHVLLRKYLKIAVDKDLISNNIMLKVKRPKIKQFISECYNSDEIQTFLRCTERHRLSLEFHIAAYYGLRRSEIIGLKFSAIDFKEKKIIINTTVSKKTSKVVIKKRTKNKSSYRILPLINIIEEKILERKKRIEMDKEFYKNSYNKAFNDFICVQENGNLVSPDMLSQNFQAVIKRYNLKKIRFHDLRHSCATLLYKKGVPLKDIQLYLGHSSIATTANIYSHFDYSQNEKSIKVIEDSLKK